MNTPAAEGSPHLLVIAGPTASGKTQLGLQLAQQLDAELVGADSMQVYRGFDIGTAKPKAELLQGVQHHGIDLIEPEEPFDAMAFARYADGVIQEVAARGKLPIVIGGTGLWLQALLRGLVSLPPADPALRVALQAEATARGLPAMHAELQRVDARVAARLHVRDGLRILRALEVFRQTGQPLGELQAAHARGLPRYRASWLVLSPPADVLRQRIAARLHAMVSDGWCEEAERLLQQHGVQVKPMDGLGYRQWVAYLRGLCSLDETLAAIRKATLAYARHQRTWLRGLPPARWSLPSPEPSGVQNDELRLVLGRM